MEVIKMKKWTVLIVIISLVLILSVKTQAANISDAELATLKAKDAQLEAEIAKLKAEKVEIQKAIKEMADSAKRDVGNRSLLNKGLETSIAQANKRIDSAENSLVALSEARKNDILVLQQLKNKYNELNVIYDKIAQETKKPVQIVKVTQGKLPRTIQKNPPSNFAEIKKSREQLNREEANLTIQIHETKLEIERLTSMDKDHQNRQKARSRNVEYLYAKGQKGQVYLNPIRTSRTFGVREIKRCIAFLIGMGLLASVSLQIQG